MGAAGRSSLDGDIEGSRDGQDVASHVPLAFKIRGGKKEIISVGSPSGPPPDPRPASLHGAGPAGLSLAKLRQGSPVRWHR